MAMRSSDGVVGCCRPEINLFIFHILYTCFSCMEYVNWRSSWFFENSFPRHIWLVSVHLKIDQFSMNELLTRVMNVSKVKTSLKHSGINLLVNVVKPNGKCWSNSSIADLQFNNDECINTTQCCIMFPANIFKNKQGQTCHLYW